MRNRRTFIAALIGGLLAAALTAEAQGPGKVARIAFLTTTSPENSPTTDAFRRALRDLGYVEGQNLAVEWRWGRGTTEQFPEFAADVVRLNVDVIVAANTAAGRAAQRATKTIPIVIPTMGDPVADGFVASLAQPGGNITGLSFQSPDLQGKRLQILREALPSVFRVALLMDSNETKYRQVVREAESAARAIGVRPQPLVEVQSPNDLPEAFSRITRERANAVLVVGGTMLYVNRVLLAQHALKARLPMVCDVREDTEAGCLMSYGASLEDLFHQAAKLVARLLRGARPSDLPVEQPTKFDLVINLKTAKALGLTIPPSLLQRADEVIE
ncbi:MAG TPA: ABC transporter substrate-binding protein [Isosphaeraceae bacterium]|nr:ABC transporter substrate-binding protein [Isosphaeraceae bacterium]